MYLSEIAHPTIRASLCSAAKVFSHIGLLASFALGAWLDWRQLAMVCAGAPLMLVVTANYVPETPSFLLLNGKERQAEASLRWLRGAPPPRPTPGRHCCNHRLDRQMSEELSTIHNNITRSDQPKDCGSVLLPRFLSPLGVCCGMMVFLR